MATRLSRRAALLSALALAAGCGLRSPQRLADKSGADTLGRVRVAGEAAEGGKPKRPARLEGNIALVSNVPRHVEPAVITPRNFDEVVLSSPVPVLVDCSASWCGPCQKMLPVVHELAAEYEGRAVVAKLDVDACPEIAGRYGVSKIPAFLIFQNGELVDSVVGAVPKSHLGGKLDAVATPVQTVSGEARR